MAGVLISVGSWPFSAIRNAISALMLFVSAACWADTPVMSSDDNRAQVGQASRSSGITVAPGVEFAFERAMAAAKQRSAGTLTTEQLMIELLNEETAAELLSSAAIDANALRADLNGHLAATASSDSEVPQPDELLQNAMRRAVLKVLMSNQKGATGADLVLAILAEGQSHSAELLRKHGLTVESVEHANLERYIRRSDEQAKRLAELQQRSRVQRERTAGNDSPRQTATELRVGGGTLDPTDDSGHRLYKIRVASDDGAAERIAFKAAVSRNGILDLYIEETPFEIEFVARTIVGLFETIEGGDRLRVQLITELDGQPRSVSGFSGSAGAIFRDHHQLMGQRSGALD